MAFETSDRGRGTGSRSLAVPTRGDYHVEFVAPPKPARKRKAFGPKRDALTQPEPASPADHRPARKPILLGVVCALLLAAVVVAAFLSKH